VTKISYEKSKSAWDGFVPFLQELICGNDIKSVCDIGGGANPMLSSEFVKESGVDYSILDISEDELKKAPEQYSKVLANIASSDFNIDKSYDMIFSKMLAEHIADADQFHKNVFSCLADGGLAVHFFPTLYTLPFFINCVIPEAFADALLNRFSPRDRYKHDKFPAYYRWCFGPTHRQMNRFKSLGYEVVEYRGFFGHGDYYNKIKILKKLHNIKTEYLLRHPNPIFTSYAIVVLKKPTNI